MKNEIKILYVGKNRKIFEKIKNEEVVPFVENSISMQE